MATARNSSKYDELDSKLGRILREGVGEANARLFLEFPQILVSAAATTLAAYREIQAKPTRRLIMGESARTSLSPEESKRMLEAHMLLGDWMSCGLTIHF